MYPTSKYNKLILEFEKDFFLFPMKCIDLIKPKFIIFYEELNLYNFSENISLGFTHFICYLWLSVITLYIYYVLYFPLCLCWNSIGGEEPSRSKGREF